LAGTRTRRRLLFVDGIHPNDHGFAALAQKLAAHLLVLLPPFDRR